MADKKIPDLTAAQTIDLTDLLLLEHGNSTDGFDSQKLIMSVFATWLASQAEFPLLLNTTEKDLIGAINEINAGGGGGSSTLSGLTDTAINNPANGQILKYNTTSGKWENANESGGGSSSVLVLHNQLNALTVDVTADDIYNAYTSDKALLLSVLANGQYIIFPCTKQTDFAIGDGVTLEFEGNVAGNKWLYVISADATNDIVSLTRTTTALPVYEDTATQTLTAGSTSLTFTVTQASTKVIDIYADKYGLAPTNVTISSNSVVLTFEAQTTDVDVFLRVSDH